METVDLLAAHDRLVRNYSSGMKQWLGIALALPGTPELPLLDEPTNGLDPAGIHEVRNLVRDLPKRHGITVFLSSHLLAEVEQVATHFAIISQGQLKFEGTPEELRMRTRQIIVADVDWLGSMPYSSKRGVAVSHLVTQRSTLEDAFPELTSSPAATREYAER